MLGTYLARMGITLATSALRPRLGVLDLSRMPIRVWPTEIDTYGHLNNGRFLTLMDFGRLDYSLRVGLVKEALRQKWRPLVAAATVRFRRELQPLERCDLTSRIAFWDERAFYFEHTLERGDLLFARAFIRGVVKRQGQSVPPADMFAALGFQDEAPSAPEELSRWIDFLKA